MAAQASLSRAASCVQTLCGETCFFIAVDVRDVLVAMDGPGPCMAACSLVADLD